MSELSYKEQKHQAREEQIISTAQKIFAEKGLLKSTMEEVAAAIPISKATLYRHFKNKHDLFLIVVKKEIEQFRTTMIEAISQETDPFKQLVVYSELRFRSTRELINLYQITDISELGSFPNFGRQIKVYKDIERGIVQKIFIDGVKKGIFKNIASNHMAEVIVNSVNGMEQAWAFAKVNDKKIAKRVEQLMRVLHNGIGTTERYEPLRSAKKLQ